MSNKQTTTPLYHPKFWLIWLAMGILRVLVILPHAWLITIGRLFGRVLLIIAKRRRHIASVNLRLCYPELSDEQHKQLLQQTFEANAIGFVEAGISWLRPNRLPKLELVNFENFDKLMASGKGLILVGAHYTTLDLAGRLLGGKIKLNVLQRPQNNPVINYLMNRGRNSYLETPAMDQRDFRSIVKCLKQRRCLWFPADQDHGIKSSVFAPFFGIQAATLEMPTRLAKLTGANVAYLSYFRKADNSYRIELIELENFTGSDTVADATLLNAQLEKSLAAHPEQYMWVHRRFKTRPEGEPNVYE